jgi:hypothetical protein
VMEMAVIGKPSKGFYANADALMAILPTKNRKKEWIIQLVFYGGWKVEVVLGKVSDSLAFSVAEIIAKEVWGVDAKTLSTNLDDVLQKIVGGESSAGEEKEEDEA